MDKRKRTRTRIRYRQGGILNCIHGVDVEYETGLLVLQPRPTGVRQRLGNWVYHFALQALFSGDKVFSASFAKLKCFDYTINITYVKINIHRVVNGHICYRLYQLKILRAL